jgi:CRISPR/Cas system CSM-associated protein Csm3 (group 7 of RAMP superfamily)
MHKTRYNALYLRLQIRPKGPLLIKAGGISANPALPDMQFVRTFHPDLGETVYIPGSSLKGVVRGFVEKALRTWNDRTSWKWACSTFEEKGKPPEEGNCPQRIKHKEKVENRSLSTEEIYANSCGACRIFGHTRLRGRLSFTDFFPVEDVRTEIRYGVAVSRLTHAVAQGPFEMEVAVAGTFQGALVLENFEIWQLGLLTTALEAMNLGLLKVGFGKNRGFGEVEARIVEAQVEEIVTGYQKAHLRGLMAFVSNNEAQNYGLYPPDALEGVPEPQEEEPLGLYMRRRYSEEAWAAIARQALQALAPARGVS